MGLRKYRTTNRYIVVKIPVKFKDILINEKFTVTENIDKDNNLIHSNDIYLKNSSSTCLYLLSKEKKEEEEIQINMETALEMQYHIIKDNYKKVDRYQYKD